MGCPKPGAQVTSHPSFPFSSYRSSLPSWRPLSLNCKTTPQLSESEQSEFLSFITFASCLGKRCVSLLLRRKEKKKNPKARSLSLSLCERVSRHCCTIGKHGFVEQEAEAEAKSRSGRVVREICGRKRPE